MSATGRNLEGHERHPDDFFRTPAWATMAIARQLPLGGRILDAGCGDGAIMSTLVRIGCPNVSGVELDLDRARQAKENANAAGDWGGGVWREDFLAKTYAYDAVVMNPPFSLAEEFIRHSLMRVAPKVVSLLRLGFLESDGRAKLHREFPSDVYVFPSRPSFAHGKTDASAYAWFAWGFSEGGHWSILDVGDKAWRKANP